MGSVFILQTVELYPWPEPLSVSSTSPDMTINNVSRYCQVSSEDEIISDGEALAWSERTRNISCSNQNTHLTQLVSFGPITQIAIAANLEGGLLLYNPHKMDYCKK